MKLSKQKIEEAYQKNAKMYDFAVKVIYPLIGLKISEYRKRAVDCLDLKEGDFVIDLGCGTGLCFSLLIEKIGQKGTLLGVDVSSEMLSLAEQRVRAAGWSNVTLIHSDIENYDFPEAVDGLISTGVFGYLQEREAILKKIYNSLVINGKIVIVDGKRPQGWPLPLFKLFVSLSSPYGLTESYFDNNTSELVSYLYQNVTFEELYGGLLYITSGEKVCITNPDK